MYTVCAQAGRGVEFVEYPKCALRDKVVRVCLQHCTVHLTCILTKNWAAHFPAIFVHHASAQLTKSTVRYTNWFATVHFPPTHSKSLLFLPVVGFYELKHYIEIPAHDMCHQCTLTTVDLLAYVVQHCCIREGEPYIRALLLKFTRHPYCEMKDSVPVSQST